MSGQNLQRPRTEEDALKAMPGDRTWADGERCDECCNGDRCDEPGHYDRMRCPHCLTTGYALWNPKGLTAWKNYRGLT